MSAPTVGTGRSPGVTYQELLDGDTREVPESLRRRGTEDVGPIEIPIGWYLNREIHDLEVERLWKRVRQVACREEDIPAAGDTWVYDIADVSILVVRVSDSTIKAFYNACLHRGRALRDFPGRVPHLQCPFHGFTWNLDGTLKEIPSPWDFADLEHERFCLPEVNVACWGGFVFVNPDPGAGPLDAFLGDLPSQFSRWPLEHRFKEVHVAKVMPANWKLVQEAFMESFHVITTHPELLGGLGDANSQFDVFDNYSRAISASATPSPHLRRDLSEQEILDATLLRWSDQPRMVELPDGMTARAMYAVVLREIFRPALGDNVDALSDAEMQDALYFTLFPNLHPWGGFSTRITYRFRPHGDDHTKSVMECMFLSPFPEGERPPAVPVHWLGEDDDWRDAPELGLLANVFNQDSYNLGRLPVGLRNNQRGRVRFARYQELKIRHFYHLWQRQLGLDADG